MAATIWDPSVRSTFIERVSKLTADSKAQWGKMNASGMLAHLNDSYRMATGELTVRPKNLPLRYTPIRQLIIYVLPFPKGAPTAPELVARCDGAVLEDEREIFSRLFNELGVLTPSSRLQPHPAFGPLTYREYGDLMAKHTQHHFRQFGL
jgi:Protein of unknown function (DUF1569)